MNVNFQMLPEAVADLDLDSKGESLREISQIFSNIYGAISEDVFDGLEERERLGSTGFGNGVAIPHTRSPQVKRPVAALVRLKNPVDFDSADGMPVRLIFGLLSPEDAGVAHLHALAAISRIVRDETTRHAFLDAPSSEAMYALLSSHIERDAA